MFVLARVERVVELAMSHAGYLTGGSAEAVARAYRTGMLDGSS
jgi:hypothetical protein